MPLRNPNEKPSPPLRVTATANADGSVSVEGDLPPGFPRRVWVVKEEQVNIILMRYLLNAEVYPTLDKANEAIKSMGPESSFVDAWIERSDPDDGSYELQVEEPRQLERIVQRAIVDLWKGTNKIHEPHEKHV